MSSTTESVVSFDSSPAATTAVANSESRALSRSDRPSPNNTATPEIKVDADTYRVWADGELLTCEPARVLPMAQRYFLF